MLAAMLWVSGIAIGVIVFVFALAKIVELVESLWEDK